MAIAIKTITKVLKLFSKYYSLWAKTYPRGSPTWKLQLHSMPNDKLPVEYSVTPWMDRANCDKAKDTT